MLFCVVVLLQEKSVKTETFNIEYTKSTQYATKKKKYCQTNKK